MEAHTKVKSSWLSRFAAVVGAVCGSIWVAGCSQPLAPPIRSGEPIGVQLMRADPAIAGAPFRVLLDFESQGDLSFVSGSAGPKTDPDIKLDTEVAHTGKSALQIPGGSSRGHGFVVKLPAMLPPGHFPGSWTLLGGYFISRDATRVDVAYRVGGKAILHRSVDLAPRAWTPVMVDLSPLADPNNALAAEIGVLTFTTYAQDVWCDDILLLDNTMNFVGDPDKAGDSWTVRRRGFATLIEKPGSFKLSIPTPEAQADGWRLVEFNDLRARLVSADGKRTWTIYYDGRAYQDGQFKPTAGLLPELATHFAEEQSSPAELAIPEELGRLERNTPGDANHDGYQETTGAYQIKAAGPRIEVTLTPRTPKLPRPILEIAGLPAGSVTATVEGKLIERVIRRQDGHVLLEVPGLLDRPITLSLRVQ